MDSNKVKVKKEYRRVGTHDGRFHADEVMATAILKEIFRIDIVRTRDKQVLDKLDIVYDVGGGEFDHHGIDKVYREDGVPFAACGLIWNKFGRDVIKFKNPSLKDDDVEAVFSYIDRILIEGIDALDNGVKISDGEIPLMSISSIISGFNPNLYSDKNEDEAFNEIVEIVSAILSNTLNNRFAVLKSREYVIKAYQKRKNPKLLVLDKYYPYGEVLQEIDENEEVDFVIFGRKDSYAVQTVRDKNGEDRKKLPAKWAGKRDEELAELTGVKDAVFCHTGRFIAVAESYEGIMKLAQLAISQEEPKETGGLLRFIRNLISRK